MSVYDPVDGDPISNESPKNETTANLKRFERHDLSRQEILIEVASLLLVDTMGLLESLIA